MRFTLTNATNLWFGQAVDLAFIGPLLLLQAGTQGQQPLGFRAGIHCLALHVANDSPQDGAESPRCFAPGPPDLLNVRAARLHPLKLAYRLAQKTS